MKTLQEESLKNGESYGLSRWTRQLVDRGLSQRGGKNPAWYYNVAAHPDNVQIEMAGRIIPVTAEQLDGKARERAWGEITQASRRFAKYARQTDRELPVIRLKALRSV